MYCIYSRLVLNSPFLVSVFLVTRLQVYVTILLLFFCSGAFILESSALAISNCALHYKQVALNTPQTHYLRERDEAAGRLLLLPSHLSHVLHSINFLSPFLSLSCVFHVYSYNLFNYTQREKVCVGGIMNYC